MDYTIYRRSFLGATLLAIPGVGLLAGLARLCFKEAEFTILFFSNPAITVTTYTNGMLTATWAGCCCEVIDVGEWKKITCRVGDSNLEMRANRFKPNTLYIDMILMCEPK